MLVILFVLVHVLKISATWEGEFLIQELPGVIFYQLVDKELSSQYPMENLKIQNSKSAKVKYSDGKH